MQMEKRIKEIDSYRGILTKRQGRAALRFVKTI